MPDVLFTDQPVPGFVDTAQADTYVGPNSWTPPNGAVQITFVLHSKASQPPATVAPALAGNSLTHALIGSAPYFTAAASLRRLSVFRALVTGATNGPLTVTFGGVQQTGCAVLVVTMTQCKTTGGNGADAVVQVATSVGLETADPGGSVPLAAFGNWANGTLACFALTGALAGSLLAKAGYTPSTERVNTSPDHLGRAEWAAHNDTLPSMTWPGSNKWAGIALEIANATPATGVNPTHGPIVGGVTLTTATLTARLDGAGSYTLRYGTDPGLAGATEVAVAVTSTTDFWGKTAVAGLTPGTTYYCQAVGTSGSTPIGLFKTLPPAPTTLKLLMLTDFQKMAAPPLLPPGTAFSTAAADMPDLVFLGGDFDHTDPAGGGASEATALTNTRAMWTRLLGVSHMADFVISILRKSATVHTWDDHDYAFNNADKNFAHRDTVAKRVFSEVYPHYPLPAVAGGIWQGGALGPIRYGTLAELFILDSRSQRDDNGDADTSAKSLLDGNALGATGQKQWLKDALLASPCTWKLVMAQVTWNTGSQKGIANFDNWYGYKTEQTELTAFIQANGIKNVVMVTGDVHMGGLNNGVVGGGIPEIVGPPPNFVPGGGEGFGNLDVLGTWSHGIWEDNGYTLFDISASQLVVRIKDLAGVTQLTMTLTAESQTPPGGAISSRDYVLPGGKLILERDIALAPSSVPANSAAEQLFAVLGARPGDGVTLNKPVTQSGLGIVGLRVSAVDEIGIVFVNVSGAPITPSPEVYSIRFNRG